MKFELIKFPLDCIDDCSDVYDPVCGTDETTYLNECHLNLMACINKNNRTQLKISYPGKCQAGKYKIIVWSIRNLIKTLRTVRGSFVYSFICRSGAVSQRCFRNVLTR